ncbi:MAG: DUF2267 domain-containing protein [Polyangiales bacterium]
MVRSVHCSPAVDYTRLIDEVCERTELKRREDAADAVALTLEALGRVLDMDGGPAIRAMLPEAIARLLTGQYAGTLLARRFFEFLGESTTTRVGVHKEDVQVVCEALANALEDESLLVLQRFLPEDIAVLLSRPSPSMRPMPSAPVHVQRRKVAEITIRPHNVAPTGAWSGPAHPPLRAREE